MPRTGKERIETEGVLRATDSARRDDDGKFIFLLGFMIGFVIPKLSKPLAMISMAMLAISGYIVPSPPSFNACHDSKD